MPGRAPPIGVGHVRLHLYFHRAVLLLWRTVRINANAIGQLGHSSSLVWLLLVGALLIPGVWVAARIGQKTGRDQMLHLVSTLYHTLDADGEVHRVE